MTANVLEAAAQTSVRTKATIRDGIEGLIFLVDCVSFSLITKNKVRIIRQVSFSLIEKKN